MPALGPRLVVAGTHSGAGKTTVATGIMAALSRAGMRVASAKVGPDFIDPGYHSLATGMPARNLDAWICGSPAIAPLAARAGAQADLLVIEGVMGLFDGAGSTHEASTAEIAVSLGAPIILVVDAEAMSASVAALLHGFHTLRADVSIAAVILNRVGSSTHEELLREALHPMGIPVLGALKRDDSFVWRDRHLGLVPVAEDPQKIRQSLDLLADAIAAQVDLAGLVALARSAQPATTGPLPETKQIARTRIAVAGGPAFSFTYPDNLERLAEAGAELVPFDPAIDRALPDGINGLYAGGGFPEVYLESLADNTPLLADVRQRIQGGLVTWAECGGLLWLCGDLDGKPMCGVVPGSGRMTSRLTLGYRNASVLADNPIAEAGDELRGHEFHYSTIDRDSAKTDNDPGNFGAALHLSGRLGGGFEGFVTPTLLATYLHLHLGADPTPAERFVAIAAGSVSTAANGMST